MTHDAVFILGMATFLVLTAALLVAYVLRAIRGQQWSPERDALAALRQVCGREER